MLKQHIKVVITTVLAFLFTIGNAEALTIRFGTSGRINYELATGVFSIYQGQLKIFENGFSEVRLADQHFRSTDKYQREYSKTMLKDGFGNGTKHVFLSTRNGSPAFKQIFYTYPGREYFLMEVEVMGRHIETNQLIPVSGHYLAPATIDLLSLFVPFDNDAFIRYDAKKLSRNFKLASAEVGAIYSNTSRNGLIIGSVEQQTWKTGMLTKAHEKEIWLTATCGFTAQDLTRDKIEHGKVSGTNVKSAKVFFGYFADWRKGMEAYAKAGRIADPPIIKALTKTTPIGWNSWGVIQEKLTYEKAVKVVDFLADSLSVFRSGNTCFVDLDSYWDNLLQGGLNGDYSRLKAFATYSKKKGLKPGIYWAPFTDWGFKGGPQRKVDGTDFTYGEMWTKVGNGFHDFDGARALDPTHPGTQYRVKLVIDRLKSCGFEMIKIDFLGHAAAESTQFADPKITTGMQAYRVGMEYLTKQLDGKMLVYAAISPSLASSRYVHMRRIACDAFKSISDTEYTLNSLTNGWWQTYLYDYIDADHVVLAKESTDVNTARVLSAVVTGTLMLGDDFSESGPWSRKAMDLFKNPELLAIIKNGKSFKPVEGDNEKSASTMFVKNGGQFTYLAIFNYENNAKDVKFDFSRLGLLKPKIYQAISLIDKQSAELIDGGMISLRPHQAMVFKITNP